MLTVIAILWVVIWALTLVDLFRRDWSAGKKAAWALIMLIFPIVGVIGYVIVRPPAAGDVHGIVPANERPSDSAHDRHPV